MKVDQSLDLLWKRTSVNTQSETIMRELLQVYIVYVLANLEMHAIPSEVVNTDNSQIISIRPCPPLSYFHCNSSRPMETLANVCL